MLRSITRGQQGSLLELVQHAGIDDLLGPSAASAMVVPGPVVIMPGFDRLL